MSDVTWKTPVKHTIIIEKHHGEPDGEPFEVIETEGWYEPDGTPITDPVRIKGLEGTE